MHRLTKYPVISFVLLAAIVVLLDQGSKLLALQELNFYESIPVIPSILYLTLIRNQGAAFGLLQGMNELFLGCALVLMAFILVYLKRSRPTAGMILTLSLVFGGAAGNMIDRIRLGAVTDFIDLRVWPVFNLADSCIVVGCLVLILMVFFSKDFKENA